jgi:hypothetical protein
VSSGTTGIRSFVYQFHSLTAGVNIGEMFFGQFASACGYPAYHGSGSFHLCLRCATISRGHVFWLVFSINSTRHFADAPCHAMPQKSEMVLPCQ